MQSVVILRALELSASKVSLSRLVFWWLTCIPVLFFILFILFFLLLLLIYILFYFIYLFSFFFLVLCLKFFRVFCYSNFLLLGSFINLISMHNQYPLLAFKVCLPSRLSFVQLHLRLFCLSAMQSHNLHTVTQKLVV